MATQYNQEKAEKDAVQSIETTEADRLKHFKVTIKHDQLANKPEDEDELIDENGKPNGPQNLAEELQVRKIFKCLFCKNIPIAPVVQCTDCEQMYCNAQCLEPYKVAIEKAKAEREEKARKEEEAQAAAKKEAEVAEGAEMKEEAPETDKKVEDVEKVAEEAPTMLDETTEKKGRKRRNRGRGEAKVVPLPDKVCCLNKKCKTLSLNTQPLGRIVRNIMNTFEFEHEGDTLMYEHYIKQQKETFKECQVYQCPYGCDTEQPLSLKKEEMKEHIVKECPNFILQCTECSYEYKRCDFYNNEIHNCVKNLLEQISKCSTEILKLKSESEEEAKNNIQRLKKIEELEAQSKELQDKYNKISAERSKHENMNYDLFGSRFTYNNGFRMPLKLPKNFLNTLANKNEGKLLEEPLYVNNERKKKGDPWQTTSEIELVFKRKIAFNAYSYSFWTGEPKKVEEEKVEEAPVKKEEGTDNKAEGAEIQEQPAEQQQQQQQEEEEVRPGNRSYMYIYLYDMSSGKEVQVGYQHFSNAPKEQKPVEQHQIKWRDGNSVITDHMKLKFLVYNDMEREQFEKLLLTDFKFYF